MKFFKIEEIVPLNRLILYLIRLKLGVKKYERFRFSNQEDDCFYTIDEFGLQKNTWLYHGDFPPSFFDYKSKPSRVSLNWLLSNECQVKKTLV